MEEVGQVRRATVEDIDAMVDVTEVVAGEGRWIGRELPLDREERAAVFRASIGDVERLVLVAERRGDVVGHLGMSHDAMGHAELGMMLVSDERGRGLGSALLAEAIAWADAHPVIHKVGLQVWPHNTVALRLYAKHGFEVEGTLRQHWRRRDGSLWDAVLMGRLVTDRMLAEPTSGER